MVQRSAASRLRMISVMAWPATISFCIRTSFFIRFAYIDLNELRGDIEVPWYIDPSLDVSVQPAAC